MLIEGNKAGVAMAMLVTESVSRGSEDRAALSSGDETERKKDKKESWSRLVL